MLRLSVRLAWARSVVLRHSQPKSFHSCSRARSVVLNAQSAEVHVRSSGLSVHVSIGSLGGGIVTVSRSQSVSPAFGVL